MKKNEKYGLGLAAAALADNITTYLAVQAGAVETNPLVAPFLAHPALFAAFTVAKTLLCYYVAAKTFENTARYKLVYFTVLLLFIQAAARNALNAAVLLKK
ncbi:MAG: DUF5658 family protein [Thermofilum sp.]